MTLSADNPDYRGLDLPKSSAQDDTPTSGIVESFRRSAQDYRAGKIPPTTLVTKFNALIGFKAGPEEKQDLTRVLYDTVKQEIVEKVLRADPVSVATDYYEKRLSALVGALKDPDIAPLTPPEAAGEFAGISIAVVDRVGSLDAKDFKKAEYPDHQRQWYQAQMDLIARSALEFAQAMPPAAERSQKQQKLKP